MVLVICGSLIVAYSTGFDIVDDHLFLLSLASGRTLFGVNILLTHGRFAPVDGAAYNALLLIMPRVTSVALHASNALEFLLFSFILLRLLELEVSRNAAIFAAAIFLVQPSFVTAVNRLLVPERTACLAIVTMLYCYRRASGKIGWLLCLLAANVAIYSKEPIAGAVLVFACCQIFLRKFGEQTKTGDGTRSLDLALAASAIGFFVLYKLLTGSSHSVSYASARRFLPFFANVAQNIRGHSLFSDPFLFFVALPLSVCRFWGNLRRPSTWRGSTDAALFAGVAYMFATLVLNLS